MQQKFIKTKNIYAEAKIWESKDDFLNRIDEENDDLNFEETSKLILIWNETKKSLYIEF